MGQPYYNSGVRQPGLLVVRRLRYFTLFQGVALLEEVTQLNTPVPNVWLIPHQRIVGEGQRPAIRRAPRVLLELANHGVFHANQVSFIVVNLSLPFQTKLGINLKTQALRNGSAPRFSFAQYSKKFRLLKVDGLLAEVHVDWEDLKEMLSPVEAVGGYNKLLA